MKIIISCRLRVINKEHMKEYLLPLFEKGFQVLLDQRSSPCSELSGWPTRCTAYRANYANLAAVSSYCGCMLP